MSVVTLVIASACMVSTAYAKKYPQEESYNYQRAVEAYIDLDLEEAAKWIDLELSKDPKNGFAYALLASICTDMSEYGDALASYQKALDYLPKKAKESRAYTLSQRGDAHLALGDTLAAINDYEMAIKTTPEDGDLYLSLAQLYTVLENYDKSDAILNTLTKKGLEEKQVLTGHGKNAMDRGDYDTALRYFNEAVQRYPDNGHAYAFRSQIYMNQGKWTESVNDIISAYRNNPPDWFLEYVASFDKRGLPFLASRIKLEMAKEPDNISLPLMCGLAYEESGDYTGAIDWYERAVAIQPLGGIYRGIAMCYDNMDNHQKAIEYYDKALAMNEDDADSLHNKIVALCEMGRHEEALALCDRNIELAPDAPAAYAVRGYVSICKRDWKQASEDFEAMTLLMGSLDNVPASMTAFLADALRLDGQMVRAEYYYNKVLEAEKALPLGFESHTPLAYASLGRRQDALETLSYIKLVLTPEQESGFLYQTACVYARLGDTDKALEALSKALDKGYEDYDHILEDYDMDPLRDTPEFEKLLNERFPQKQEKLKNTPVPVNGEYPIGNIEIDGYIGSQAAVRTEIPFKREDGVTKVQCSINGLPLHFVFDTGAGDVTMSLVEANFMLKNGYLKRSDIKGSARYIDANGDISEGTVINLRHINLGGVELENVRASVVRNQRAPLLLGQSVLSRLGKIEIDNPGSRLIIINPDSKKK